MRGLVLQLLKDRQGAAAEWFWPCFEPLRAEFDKYYWIFPFGPWMSYPVDFDEHQTERYEGEGQTSISLWKPGTIGRWADQFGEEFVQLWAIDPVADPMRVLTEFLRKEDDRCINRFGVIWLSYTDSTCWEIFARDRKLLERVKASVQGNDAVRAFDSSTMSRSIPYAKLRWPWQQDIK